MTGLGKSVAAICVGAAFMLAAIWERCAGVVFIRGGQTGYYQVWEIPALQFLAGVFMAWFGVWGLMSQGFPPRRR